MAGMEMSDGTGAGLPRRAAAAAWRWLPLAGLVAIWAAHCYWSVTLRPDVVYLDEWDVFAIPGYSRSFALANVFGTQSDTVAAYQNLLQWLVLVAFDLRMPAFVAVQNLFLLAFLLAAWRVLASTGAAGRTRSPAVALLLVPAFAGTFLFLGPAMTFNQMMPMVYLVLATLVLRVSRLGPVRQPLAGCLLFLSGAAYISGWMYLLAATLAAVAARLLQRPARGGSRPDGLPAGSALAGAWIALAASVAASVWLSHAPFPLAEGGVNYRNMPLLWPWDGRFWTFYPIAVARGAGLPPAAVWGAAALAAALLPLAALAVRLPRGTGRDAAAFFALAAPVLGALLALAAITAGRALFDGADPAAVEAFARDDRKYVGKYALHMTFALPFVAAAWFALIDAGPGMGRAGRTWASAAVAAVLLAGFASGGGGPPAERLAFRTIFEEGNAFLRDRAVCLENAVRLARATEAGVPIRCPGLRKGDLRARIERAERAGVSSIVGIADRPPLAPERVRAAIAAAAGTAPAGEVATLEIEDAWLRLTGRVARTEAGAHPRWIAVSVPGRPIWIARTGGTGSIRGRVEPAHWFDIVVPAGPRPAAPGNVSAWALSGVSGGKVAAVPLPAPRSAFANRGPVWREAELLDAPPEGPAPPGGYIDRAVWGPDGTLRLVGWMLANGADKSRRLSVYAPGASAVAKTGARRRPDVVEGLGGDMRLLDSGFSIVLGMADGAGRPPFVCARSEDGDFGPRALRVPAGLDSRLCAGGPDRGEAVSLDAPPDDTAAPGGYIDRTVWDAGARTLTVEGWAMADGEDEKRWIGFYAPGAAALARFETISRPDVVAAHGGDPRLRRSGFSAVLRFPEDAPEPPCVRARSEDRAFGRRALRGSPGRNPAACAPGGEGG